MIYIIISSAVLLMLYVFMRYGLNYQDFQIWGVLFKPEHAKHKDTKKVQKKYQRLLAWGIVLFLLLQCFFLLPPLRHYLDFSLIFILLGYTAYGFLVLERARQALIRLKPKHAWFYERPEKRLADTEVSLQKGKSAPGVLWVWLIWLLNFLPFLFFYAAGEDEALFYVILALTPLSLMVIPLIYKRALRSRRQMVSPDKTLNKAYARASERETGLGLIRIFLALTLWWNAFALLFLAEELSPWMWLLSFAVFFLLLTGLLFYGRKKRETINRRFYEKSVWRIPEEDKHYRWGFYYNKTDSRLMVPKPVESMGYTLNMAKPQAKIIMGLTLALIVFALTLALRMGTAEFRYIPGERYFEIEAPFYSLKPEAGDIETVEWSEEPIRNAARLHGMAGREKRYGAFRLPPYGRVNLYVYNQVQEHIVLELAEGGKAEALVLNEDTAEKTRALYEALLKWRAEAGASAP